MSNDKFMPIAEPSLSHLELQYVTDAVRSGWVSSKGPFVDRFEQSLAEYLGARFAVSTCNGTAALHLALAALGVGPGDEVIVPTLTFIATANAVRYVGATPVLCDVDSSTWCMRAADAAPLLTSRTKAIIPVHLYGHPADMDDICALAAHHNLLVVEDAAEALGACYKQRKVGTIGHASVFSFYGNKMITTGEGGMLVTDDPDLYQRARVLRDHGMDPDRRYWHPWIGFNFRLTNLQAALGVAQLTRIDDLLGAKISNAQAYRRILAGIPGVEPQREQEWAASSWWMFSVTLGEELAMTPNELARRLRERGIDSRPVFHPIHHMPPYHQDLRLPVSERIARTGLSLPSGALLTQGDVERVCVEIECALRANSSESLLGS
ncbi:MAG: DegT/DnrJ/EryC1/StrS family aminotransferase [Chloroflexi bacterium]|nr:DegT/DnrJ/EryC1/StrS family aminotransferase [Chloroflexota bacterium]